MVLGQTTYSAVGGFIRVERATADDFHLTFDVELVRWVEGGPETAPDRSTHRLQGHSRGLAGITCMVNPTNSDTVGVVSEDTSPGWVPGDDTEFCRSYRRNWARGE